MKEKQLRILFSISAITIYFLLVLYNFNIPEKIPRGEGVLIQELLSNPDSFQGKTVIVHEVKIVETNKDGFKIGSWTNQKERIQVISSQEAKEGNIVTLKGTFSNQKIKATEVHTFNFYWWRIFSSIIGAAILSYFIYKEKPWKKQYKEP